MFVSSAPTSTHPRKKKERKRWLAGHCVNNCVNSCKSPSKLSEGLQSVVKAVWLECQTHTLYAWPYVCWLCLGTKYTIIPEKFNLGRTNCTRGKLFTFGPGWCVVARGSKALQGYILGCCLLPTPRHQGEKEMLSTCRVWAVSVRSVCTIAKANRKQALNPVAHNAQWT